MLIQKRSMTKDYCPGYFDLSSCGGVVDAGEDDQIGAEREMFEELGLKGDQYTPELILTVKYEPEDGSDKIFQNIYLLRNLDLEDGSTVITLSNETELLENWPVNLFS